MQFVGSGYYTISVSWNPQEVTLAFNARRLGPYVPLDPPLEILTSARQELGPRSCDHPDAANVCREWIRKRSSKFAIKKYRKNRKQKTANEQAGDLQNAIQ